MFWDFWNLETNKPSANSKDATVICEAVQIIPPYLQNILHCFTCEHFFTKAIEKNLAAGKANVLPKSHETSV